MKNVGFGPTKFFKATIQPGTIYPTSNWISSAWNNDFVPYLSKNMDKKMVDTALYVLIQRSILPQCPLESDGT